VCLAQTLVIISCVSDRSHHGLTGSADIWATRRLGDRRLGDRVLDDHLSDMAWTFRRQQLEVWAAMNICSGRGFLLANRLQRRLVFASRCWSVYEPCLNASRSNYILIIAHRPSLCGCSRLNASFLSPKRLDACRSSVQLLSPKRPTRVAQMVISKKLSPKRLSPKRLVAQTSVHISLLLTLNESSRFSPPQISMPES